MNTYKTDTHDVDTRKTDTQDVDTYKTGTSPDAPSGFRAVFASAFTYSIPVLLGYLAIGVAFGLLLQQAGYPWYLALVMSIFMYGGSAQYIAVGLFAAGSSLWEAVLVQLVVNARHIAYGITMLKRYNAAGTYKWYLVFAMTDETFALLSGGLEAKAAPAERGRFMFLVSALDHFYWTAGSLLGAVGGGLLPFKIEGIGFALTALFVVLMIEQIFAAKKPAPFVIAAVLAVVCVAALPSRVSLLSALALSLACVQIFTGGSGKRRIKNKHTGGADAQPK
ncbi:MAG: AzlC family ABC transporter permease [Spirochaetaceae bacterium]|jgi:4-azaleucine resistance transporter AzlC|nr:AzlC family ABC transporter permease [Spirochaetaceae bacterium]